MKITVCQLDSREEVLDQQLEALAEHIRLEQSDFLLLPEMCFSDWLAADKQPDAARWVKAEQDHAKRIAQLELLGCKAYDRGDKEFGLARALDMRIGVQICTEMWFFEWARHYAKAKADLLCIPRAAQTNPEDPFASATIDLEFAQLSKTTYPRYVAE